MTMRRVFGLASALILSGCNAAPPSGARDAETAKVKAEVVSLAHARIAALNAHDADRNVSADLPDIVAMFHGAPNDVGVSADLASARAMVADPLLHVDLGAETVDVGGLDFAVYHATYDLTLTDPKTKAPSHEHGNLLIGFKRQSDGALKVTWEVVSDTPSPK